VPSSSNTSRANRSTTAKTGNARAAARPSNPSSRSAGTAAANAADRARTTPSPRAIAPARNPVARKRQAHSDSGHPDLQEASPLADHGRSRAAPPTGLGPSCPGPRSVGGQPLADNGLSGTASPRGLGSYGFRAPRAAGGRPPGQLRSVRRRIAERARLLPVPGTPSCRRPALWPMRRQGSPCEQPGALRRPLRKGLRVHDGIDVRGAGMRGRCQRDPGYEIYRLSKR